MDIKKQLNKATLILGVIFSLNTHAASIGSFNFADNAVADQLLAGNGQAYNGSTDYYGTGSTWLAFNNTPDAMAWEPTSTPADITDNSISTYLAHQNGTPALSLDVGFSNTNIFNGADSDIALFFLWGQNNNNASVTINGVTQGLSFSNVLSDSGIQQTAKNVIWDGDTEPDVRLMVAEIDLSDFDYALNSVLDQSIQIDMQSTTSNPMALSLVAGLNSDTNLTAVPLPAAAWLFITGLSALGFISRRRK